MRGIAPDQRQLVDLFELLDGAHPAIDPLEQRRQAEAEQSAEDDAEDHVAGGVRRGGHGRRFGFLHELGATRLQGLGQAQLVEFFVQGLALGAFRLGRGHFGEAFPGDVDRPLGLLAIRPAAEVDVGLAVGVGDFGGERRRVGRRRDRGGVGVGARRDFDAAEDFGRADPAFQFLRGLVRHHRQGDELAVGRRLPGRVLDRVAFFEGGRVFAEEQRRRGGVQLFLANREGKGHQRHRDQRLQHDPLAAPHDPQRLLHRTFLSSHGRSFDAVGAMPSAIHRG